MLTRMALFFLTTLVFLQGALAYTLPPQVTVSNDGVTVTWTTPTTKELLEGQTAADPLSIDEIVGYEIHIANVGTDTVEIVEVSDPKAVQHHVSALDNGVYKFAVRTLATYKAWNAILEDYVDQQWSSKWSEEVALNYFPESPPSAPGNVSVSINITVSN